VSGKNDFEERIGYRFQDPTLLEQALTHSSYTKEHDLPRICCNERLEFLGDAFFDAIIGEALYRRMPKTEEGYLTKLRALVVCEESLAETARSLGIGSLLRLGRGEEHTGGRSRRSVIADAMEAVIGALFMDAGYEKTGEIVRALFRDRVEEALAGRLHSDYKSELQEMIQKVRPAEIEYVMTGEEGPDHAKTFYIDVQVDGVVWGSGSGSSKKEAQQHAAKEAVRRRRQDVL